METKFSFDRPTRISHQELQRRWQAVREAMKERGLDFLVMQGGGCVRWFTDVPAGQIRTVIFPRDDEMTMISHGPRPPAEPFPAASEVRGVKKRLSVPVNPSLVYSTLFDAELAVAELTRYKDCHIGWVGTGFINASFYRYVNSHLTGASFEDASDMVDGIKAVKSDEELSLIRKTCQMQDEIFEWVLPRVQPGRRAGEVHADVVHRWAEMGGEGGVVMVDSAPAGKPATIPPSNSRLRVLEDGDQFNILIETIGPGGFCCEITRTICLGTVPSEMEEQWEIAREAQQVTLGLLKPGADPLACWNANNEFLRDRGYPEEGRIYAHSQGYDIVERPCLMPGETVRIQKGMNIAVHPAVVSPQAFAWVCENYVVTETGGNELLHKTPQRLFVV